MTTAAIPNYAAALLVAVGLVVLVRLLQPKGKFSKLPTPPGPKGLPVVGNIHQFPKEKEWLAYSKWAEEYGNIISLRAFGQYVVILNDYKTCVDLLDKKSTIYSDRPVLPMLSDHMGWGNTLGMISYGDRFREYRRLLHRFMGTRNAIEVHASLQEREAHNFLRRVLQDPDNVQEHIRRNAGAVILMMTYGYSIMDHNDPLIDIVDKATEQFAIASTPGAFLVDTLPFLSYVPDWFPGTEWKKKAAKWRQTLFDMTNWPYNFAQKTMSEGTAVASYTTNLLQAKQSLSAEEEHAIKWSAASLYGGGADTTVSVVYSLFLAMTLYPEIQRRAQEEIESVIGSDRLPCLADRGTLPYTEAIILELLRWQPVIPLGVPHRCAEENEYNGYRIPKDAIVMPNQWLILHDPKTYKDPFTFNPDRFMSTPGKPAEQDPHAAAFGFGRRICPGMHVADASIFLSVSNVLASFKISKVVENGVEVDPKIDVTSGVISHPVPFKCDVKPRTPKAEALIRAER